MKCFLILLVVGSVMFVTSLESEQDDQECIMGCTPHLEPICAKSSSNGTLRTFDNPCMMLLENSCYKADYKQISRGECPEQSN
uniref:Secreted Kazal protein n=1 Tax=Pristhesancus plagipennis TaxID=1955184 RepID=A0A2K8JSI6_PRIPG|nr:secreted Kazal protein [Pristhesancus plagipennis]